MVPVWVLLISDVKSPRMWVWPQMPFGGSPLRTLPSSHSPSLPTLSHKRGAAGGWRGRALEAALVGNENSAQSFSDRSFWKSLRAVDVRPFGSWMSVPTCLFFQGFEGPYVLTRASARMTPGCLLDIWPETSSLGYFFVPELGPRPTQRTLPY